MSKLPELKALAKESNLKGYSTMKKADLVKFLEESGIKIPKETNSDSGSDSSKPKKKAIGGAKKETESVSTEKKPGAKKETDSTEKKPRAKKEKPDFEEKDMIKSKKESYIFKDEKSDKFWNIIYERSENEKQKYIIQYGKDGSSGTTSKNEETSEKIQKLIEDKKKKGYVKP